MKAIFLKAFRRKISKVIILRLASCVHILLPYLPGAARLQSVSSVSYHVNYSVTVLEI